MKICSIIFLTLIVVLNLKMFSRISKVRRALETNSKIGNIQEINCPFKYYDAKGKHEDKCEGEKTKKVDVHQKCPIYFIGDDKKDYYFDCKGDQYQYNPKRMSEKHLKVVENPAFHKSNSA